MVSGSIRTIGGVNGELCDTNQFMYTTVECIRSLPNEEEVFMSAV